MSVTETARAAQAALAAKRVVDEASRTLSSALREECTHPEVLESERKLVPGRIWGMLRIVAAPATRLCTTCGILEQDGDNRSNGWGILTSATTKVTWDELVATQTPGGRAVTHWCDRGEHLALWPDHDPQHVGGDLVCSRHR